MTAQYAHDLFSYQVVPALPVAPYNRESETSRAAAESQPDAKRLLDMARVFHFVRSRGKQGATCDECETALSMCHQTCSARFSEMSNPNKPMPMQLIRSGEKRKTRSGRSAGVYVVRT